MNLPLPTGEVDFVVEFTKPTKSGEGTIFKMLNCAKKKCAFTLSEVLIVLAVLGVVAAMTIPSLIQDYKEKATVTALKKTYSVLNQAVDMSVAENGPVETWDWGTAGNGQSAVNVFREYLKPYLRLEKDCGIGKGCWYNGMITSLTGTNWWAINASFASARAILADGTAFALHVYSTRASLDGRRSCGFIYVDVNGVKGPNALGKDVFDFYITPDGIIPIGTKGDNNYRVPGSCNNYSTASYNGTACAAWVIKMGNMDYLRKTVSW